MEPGEQFRVVLADKLGPFKLRADLNVVVGEREPGTQHPRARRRRGPADRLAADHRGRARARGAGAGRRSSTSAAATRSRDGRRRSARVRSGRRLRTSSRSSSRRPSGAWMRSRHRNLREQVRLDPVEDLRRASIPVAVMPWLRSPTTACAGSLSASMSAETLCASSSLPHGIVDVGRGDAVDPGVHVDDRADLGMLAGRSASARSRRPTPAAARPPAGRSAPSRRRPRRSRRRAGCPGRDLELALVDAARAHPEPRARPGARRGSRTRGRRSRRAAGCGGGRARPRAPRSGTARGADRRRRGGGRPRRSRAVCSSPSQSSGSRSARNSFSITSRAAASGASRSTTSCASASTPPVCGTT